MFADRAKIYIRSGNGGDGHVSFRREKFVAAGGPDGGDGGKGGDIIFTVEDGMNTLIDFHHKRKYVAGNGEPGGKRRCHGADADDLIIRVPQGTVIKEFESGKVIADMSGENRREVILRGGKGGIGNMHYATSTMQVPKYAKPGQPGKELYVQLELKVIADVGLVGYPSVGKSTLISAVSNARPKIAEYHFTTLEPNLGVIDLGDGNSFIMADIPGLIEGAAEGVGLGHDFLRHIERTKILLHVVDAAGIEGRDPVEDIRIMMDELRRYDEKLLEKPMMIAANKIDSIDYSNGDPVEAIRKAYPDITVYPISAFTHEGVGELVHGIWNALKEIPNDIQTFEKEYDVDYSDDENLPFTVEKQGDIFVVEGPRIEKMLGYTNLDSEKGFDFFQKFLKQTGILKQLEDLGIKDGDTVRMYGHEFDYYR